MQIPVVAEWVEDAEAACSASGGVEYLQGMHFGDARIVEPPARPSETAAAAA